MKQLMDFFENLNEIVYIVDMDTYEIIYMNKKLRELNGVESVEETAGKTCYEFFQGSSEVCRICNNHKLKSEEFIEWSYFNPKLKRQLMLKDTMIEQDGRRYRIEIALDVTVQDRQNRLLDSYKNLEMLANEGFRLAMQAATPEDSLGVILEFLGKALNGERTYIVEKNDRGGDDNTYEWTAQGVMPEKENLQNLPPEICADWYQSFKENDSVIIEDIEEVREIFPVQYEVLKRQEVHSLVVVPLYEEKQIIGFYGVDNPQGISMEFAYNMLQIVAYFIVSLLNRRKLMRQLHEMSYRDQLTRLGNRYAMGAYMERLQPEESIGVLYCDITGLKRLNDREGHQAGDRLLIRSGECLRKVFGEYRNFRIGGDEFLVLCAGIAEAELEKRAGELKEVMQAQNIVAAVGTVWRKRTADDEMEHLISMAENHMYADKEAYYRVSGRDRRR